jgi:hypothetical protein
VCQSIAGGLSRARFGPFLQPGLDAGRFRHDHNPDCQSWRGVGTTIVILRRSPDLDYNPRSIDGLDYEDCRKVPALPD